MAIPGLPSLPDQLTPDKEEAYLAKVSCIIGQLQGLGGNHIKEAERRIQQLALWDKEAKVNPTALFFFLVGPVGHPAPKVIFKAGCKGHRSIWLHLMSLMLSRKKLP